MFATAISGMLLGLIAPQIQPHLLPQGQMQSNTQLLYGIKGSGQSGQEGPLGYNNAKTDKFAPFTSVFGAPQVSDWSDAGTADFDGDGNQDLWFLSQSKPTNVADPTTSATYMLEGNPKSEGSSGSLSVQMARASSLGRYRSWHSYKKQSWADGTTYRSSYYTVDRVLLVEPTSTTLESAFYSETSGTWATSAWWDLNETGAYRIAARDDAGDGHEDIAVLIETPTGTKVKKLVVDTQTFPWPYPNASLETSVELPWAVEDLCMLDCDGDGRSDVIVTIPNIGIMVLVDTGTTFKTKLWLPLFEELKHVFVGNADGDGRDDFGLVFERFMMMLHSTPSGFIPASLTAPGSVADFHAGAVVGDNQGGQTNIVGFPRDGSSIVAYPLLTGQTYEAAVVYSTSNTTSFAGAGAAGTRVITGDVDGDLDEDVIIQLPDRKHWLTIRNGEVQLDPSRVTMTSYGLDQNGNYVFGFTVEVSPDAIALGLSTMEVAAFMEDPNSPGRYKYWGRVLPTVDPVHNTATFLVQSQTNENVVQSMWLNPQPNQYGGLNVGGQVLFSVHLKTGTQRYQSILIHHDGTGGEGNKSAVGVKWQVRAAPPKPDMDTDLLPWN